MSKKEPEGFSCTFFIDSLIGSTSGIHKRDYSLKNRVNTKGHNKLRINKIKLKSGQFYYD